MAEASRLTMFDRAAGTDRVRKLFGKSFRYADIRPLLDGAARPFRAASAPYLLYPD